MRRPGEPIYQRRHIAGLLLAVVLPLGLLQLYKFYVGPIGFGMQLIVGCGISIAAGLVLYRTYRSSAQNQP